VTDTMVPPAGEAPPEPDVPAVSIRGLTKRYGDVVAVRDLDLEIERGTVYGLIGPNGAGKTTTFAVLASLLRPSAGSVQLLGIDPGDRPAEVRRIMGYMPDVLGVYDDLRVDEYLDFFASSYRIPKPRRPAVIEGLLELVDLVDKRRAAVNSLSRGMKQRLSLARALVHDPEVLILDEPASGLDPRARVELRNLLVELKDMGKTIVISSHILAELEEMCSEIGIMEGGRLLVSGPPRTIRQQLGGARRLEVRFADGSREDFEVTDDAAQAALLRRLVQDDARDVLEFVEAGSGLEDLFMQITTRPEA
jgi:ABC-2 type transport system ATP-binding protein